MNLVEFLLFIKLHPLGCSMWHMTNLMKMLIWVHIDKTKNSPTLYDQNHSQSLLCVCVCVCVCIYISQLAINKLTHRYLLDRAYKRWIRKGEQGPASGPQSHHANCDICRKLCLSLAGLKSHLRKCAKSIWYPNNATASKTEQLWQNLSQLGWP